MTHAKTLCEAENRFPPALKNASRTAPGQRVDAVEAVVVVAAAGADVTGA
jgi:hypothetical protein